MGAITDAFSGLNIPLTTSPPALKPAEKLWLSANLTSFATQKLTPAAPKVSAPTTSASGGVCLFDAFEKTTNSEGVARGFDDGAVVVKMGREEPAVSMDGLERSFGPSTMKWCRLLSRAVMLASRMEHLSLCQRKTGPARFTCRHCRTLRMDNLCLSVVMENTSPTLLLLGETRPSDKLLISHGGRRITATTTPFTNHQLVSRFSGTSRK